MLTSYLPLAPAEETPTFTYLCIIPLIGTKKLRKYATMVKEKEEETKKLKIKSLRRRSVDLR